MKKVLSLTLSFALVAMLVALTADEATAQTKGRMVGKSAMNQHGSFDTDGDGIPNGQDPDYVKPQDGTGHRFGKMNGAGTMNGAGKMYGKSNGRGGSLGQGGGSCDGTGPKGNGGRH